MLKKTKAGLADKAASARGDAKDSSQAVLDSSRHIWLAGLGAFSRAQAEGMNMFEALVRQGKILETKTRRAAVDTAAAARGAAKATVKEVSQGVGGTWDKLEQVFENRVARALSKLGVYTQNDMKQLAQRVDALSAAVNELIKAKRKSSAAAATRPKKTAKRIGGAGVKTRKTGKTTAAGKTAKGAKAVRAAKGKSRKPRATAG